MSHFNRTRTRSRKRWALLIAPALTLTGALVAWALISHDTPVSGTVTGEDASASITLSNVTPDNGNSSACAWGKTADSKGITLNVNKAPRGVTTTCRASISYTNGGNVDVATQAWSVTSTAGTVTSGFNGTAFPAERCGAVAAAGGSGVARVVVQFTDVPVAASGTLTGRLQHVDSGSFSSSSCSQTL
ncbi:MAG: hypothetical protein ACLGI2_14750 [Acidimicrobiia bacterium]